MVDITTAPWGLLVLRLALGALFLAHGLRKLLVSKPAGVEGYFRSLGLPGWVGLLTMAAEILGGWRCCWACGRATWRWRSRR